jgi:hypothetical protein
MYHKTICAQESPVRKEWRIAADAYLLMLAPLYGNICSLHTILSYYRIHSSNAWYTDSHTLNEQAIPKLLHQIRFFPPTPLDCRQNSVW